MNENLKNDISKRFKQARVALNLTQEQLAGMLGIDSSAIDEIESGNSFPNFQSILFLMEKLQVSPGWLISGKGSMLTTDFNIRSVYPGIPEDETIDDLVKCLQVPIIYHRFASDFILVRMQYKKFISDYFDGVKSNVKKEA